MLPLSQLDASPKTAGILVLAVETSYLTQLDIGHTCLNWTLVTHASNFTERTTASPGGA